MLDNFFNELKLKKLALTVNFSTSQTPGSPGDIIFTDTSTGSDGSVTQRRIYIQSAAGDYLVESGTSTQYEVWSGFPGTTTITLEDILEEIVGDIKDEFDEEETTIKKIDEYHYIVEGKTAITDLCNFIDIPSTTFDSVKGESDTLAGLFLELAGEFPMLQQVVKFQQYSFTVLEIQKNRIHKIQMIITPVITSNIDHA